MKFKKFLSIFICIGIFTAGFLGFIFFKNGGKEVIKLEGSIADKTQTEVVNDSKLALTGKVKSIHDSKWSNPDFKKGSDIPNVLQTDIEFEVSEVYKGNLKEKETITVRINKGEDDNTIVESDGYPDFIENEDYLLFLSEPDGVLKDTSKEYYVLTGMIQGAYKNDGKGNYVSGKVALEEKISKEQNSSSNINTNTILKNKEKNSFHINTIKKELNTELEKAKSLPKQKTPEEVDEINSNLFNDIK